MLSTPLVTLRAMLAASPDFQEWTNSSNDEEAKQRIHIMQSERNPTLPFCLIDIGDGFMRERVLIANRRPFAQSGQLVVYFRDAVDPSRNDSDAALQFCTQLGAVWSDLEMMAGDNGHLPITAITLAAAPTRSDADRRAHVGDYFEAALTIQWQATH